MGNRPFDAVLSLDPDVVVLDISMPVMNGLQAGEYLRQLKCRTKTIIPTAYNAELRKKLDGIFEMVGAVGDGKQALDAVLSLDPDVAVLDISMPVMNGLSNVQCGIITQ